MQHPQTQAFVANSSRAVANPQLQAELAKLKTGFRARRTAAVARLPEFDALRQAARELKDHVLDNLDTYLEIFQRNVEAAGGKVHWCRTAEEARQTILAICRTAGVKTVTKGKTMVGEEIALNEFLERHDIVPIETDLGEYIIQLRREPPSHIIAPAIHLNRRQVADSFRKAHPDLPEGRILDEPQDMMDEARTVLRERFIAADLGITGANFLVAETGSTIIVTNEGNGDLTQMLPRIHVALTSIEKVVPTLEDAAMMMRLLARSSTGQEMSSYTTLSTGPRRPGDLDGPDEFHVILLDNGRSNLLGGEFKDMLRCIKCAACINHCPVYGVAGGHAYGWVYPGPMGSVLTPALIGLEKARHLPNASTLCGRCEEVCPMGIPLPRLLRHWREREFERHLTPVIARWALKAWAFFAKRPSLYRQAARLGSFALRFASRRKGRFAKMPLAGGWTGLRDLPAPSGPGFLAQWAAGKREF